MNYAQSFEEFSRNLSGTDLALYAGLGVVLWVLFKDKLSPVQKLVMDFLNSFKTKNNTAPNTVSLVSNNKSPKQEDLFFQLVASWKQTRDLAVKSGCKEAIKVADQMFPFLSPTVCSESGETNEV